MRADEERLVYLYAVVPAEAEEPPAELTGVEGGAVRLLRAGGLAAVAGEVPATTYAAEQLDARLPDLAWVGERGLAHERVLDWYAERGPVVPLSLFSLHRDEERVRQRLLDDAQRLGALLERLRGRREWAVKLWRVNDRVAEHLDSLSPLLRALSDEMEQAPPGRRFLLAKKREAARAEELRSASARLAHRAFALLKEAAERAVTVPLPAAPEGPRLLLLHAAFLVPEEGYPAFQRRVGEVAREVGSIGFEVEFTGPWPPYHFADPDAS